ncbi:MAG: hypothetical protein AAGJ50_09620 [Pseudomonadota bacterium]
MAAAATIPVALGGTESFLNRVLSDHFGADVLQVDRIGDFVQDYASLAGRNDWKKRMAAEIYFAWRGDRVKKIGPAIELEERFLRTILTRSNIIAVRQGRAEVFEYTDADPWAPGCGLYLGAMADTA